MIIFRSLLFGWSGITKEYSKVTFSASLIYFSLTVWIMKPLISSSDSSKSEFSLCTILESYILIIDNLNSSGSASFSTMGLLSRMGEVDAWSI
jgi:hypothetical protein